MNFQNWKFMEQSILINVFPIILEPMENRMRNQRTRFANDAKIETALLSRGKLPELS